MTAPGTTGPDTPSPGAGPVRVIGVSALDSRTAAVAIAYLLLGGATLDAATAAVRRVRPQAMPALELRRSLERLAERPGPGAGAAPGESLAKHAF